MYASEPRPKIEQDLVAEYSRIHETVWGLPPLAARRRATVLVDESVRRSREAGTYDLPLDLGDRFLAGEVFGPLTPERLGYLRDEGVRDEDIRRWWNQHDVSRRIQIRGHEACTHEFLAGARRAGQGADTAVERIFRIRPYYDSPTGHEPRYGVDVPTHLTVRDHRGLPVELKNAADLFVVDSIGDGARVQAADLEARVRTFGSMNALVRAAIRDGSLFAVRPAASYAHMLK